MKALIVTALALAACGPAPPPAEPPPDPAAAAKLGEAQTLPHLLPPQSSSPGGAPRFVGLWSTTVDGCSDPAFAFAPRHVLTKGEVSCDFSDVREIAGGYDVHALCAGESGARRYRMQLTFAESARAMMVAGGPWQAPTSLIYCAPLAGAAQTGAEEAAAHTPPAREP